MQTKCFSSPLPFFSAWMQKISSGILADSASARVSLLNTQFVKSTSARENATLIQCDAIQTTRC